jgi:hypothetical protein
MDTYIWHERGTKMCMSFFRKGRVNTKITNRGIAGLILGMHIWLRVGELARDALLTG